MGVNAEGGGDSYDARRELDLITTDLATFFEPVHDPNNPNGPGIFPPIAVAYDGINRRNQTFMAARIPHDVHVALIGGGAVQRVELTSWWVHGDEAGQRMVGVNIGRRMLFGVLDFDPSIFYNLTTRRRESTSGLSDAAIRALLSTLRLRQAFTVEEAQVAAKRFLGPMPKEPVGRRKLTRKDERDIGRLLGHSEVANPLKRAWDWTITKYHQRKSDDQ